MIILLTTQIDFFLLKVRMYFQRIHQIKYRIGANTTALLIIAASRVNSNIKAPKLLNLNNTTAF